MQQTLPEGSLAYRKYSLELLWRPAFGSSKQVMIHPDSVLVEPANKLGRIHRIWQLRAGLIGHFRRCRMPLQLSLESLSQPGWEVGAELGCR